MKLYIYCAGGLGAETMYAAQRMNAKHHIYSDISYIDDTLNGKKADAVSTVTYEEFRRSNAVEECEITIANGEPFIRELLFNKVIKDGCRTATVIDPDVSVPNTAVVGSGCIIMKGVCISPRTEILDNSVLYYNSVIAHDSCIGKHSVVSMKAVVSGHCSIGERVFLGAGSAMKQGTKIGKDSIVGMGSIVLHDVDALTVVGGVPAKKLRENLSLRVF